jgi:predicted nucleotidyltransferase
VPASGTFRFGSVARRHTEVDSDVDLLAELDPDARIGLFALGALKRHLAELVGRPVDLLPEPVETPRVSANLELMPPKSLMVGLRRP